MRIKELNNMPVDAMDSLLRGIPFYKDIQKLDVEQFNRVLGFSKLVELSPGDTIMRAGDKGSWLYFLLKGQLVVCADESDENTPLNYINPGELFGDLAMLSDYQRRATVKADANCKEALLFATNFARFGALEDYSTVSCETKLLLYRMMVHSIRWKLEVNRMADPSHTLVAAMRQIPVYSGLKGTDEELIALYSQARQLADLLIRWNIQTTNPKDLLVGSSSTTALTQSLIDELSR